MINKEHTVYDLWDGYIDFEFTEFETVTQLLQPVVGDIIVDEVLGGTAEIVFIKDSLTMLGFM